MKLSHILEARWAALVRGVLLVAAASGASVGAFSCGSSSAGVAGKPVDGGPQADTGSIVDASECIRPRDAGEVQTTAQLPLDGGVALEDVLLATAVARCNYFSRCSPMAPYEINECIDALSRQGGVWEYTDCQLLEAGVLCSGYDIASSPSATLLNAASGGIVAYDANAEGACLRALTLQGQTCHGFDLWFNIPECLGAFSCLEDGGSGGGADAAAADAGAGCTQLLPQGPVLRSCADNSGCADVDGGAGGPWCVAGSCFAHPCGELAGEDGGCPLFQEAGAPCNSDPPLLGDTIFTPFGGQATEPCAPGLTCRGRGAGGVLGTCALPAGPRDVCDESGGITGCQQGLACTCGVCQTPPSDGPCAAGACQLGVAFCDVASGTCMPLRSLGGLCTPDAVSVCAAGFVCDPATSTCQLP